MSEKKTLDEIKAEKLKNRVERPKKNHKTESSKEKSKRASKKLKESKDQMTIFAPKGFAKFLKEKGDGGLVNKSMTTVILEALQETSILKEFEEWQNEQRD